MGMRRCQAKLERNHIGQSQNQDDEVIRKPFPLYFSTYQSVLLLICAQQPRDFCRRVTTGSHMHVFVFVSLVAAIIGGCSYTGGGPPCFVADERSV